MGIADTPAAASRVWDVAVQVHHDKPRLICAQCGQLPQTEDFPIIRTSVLAHLADHARSEHLAAYLRICRCAERGCRWHPRHRGCAGPVSLTLTRHGHGRMWRLADTCLACTAATPHTAPVPETPQKSSFLQSAAPAFVESGEAGTYLFEEGWP
ncbi:hypothetical protein RM572_27130 [Streptomyces sp. DSM 42041]|uniref:Uncharacterized protein n=1 Tax=Streptomyces hazeniae TaxID=3075538 RepID=A0ABU2NZL9_9ACTN|nr:hypothetical protein [Streptomyces sp. DSM 42041]MDT0382436.1 hypothetical protein [Streptomyces sp. DSM 42041]